jgi:multimeric flavodoxin WrbA
MKILILFGSPKTKGSTAKLTGAFMKGIRKSDDVEIVHLFSLQPTPCNACGYCKAANGCSKKDLEKFMATYGVDSDSSDDDVDYSKYLDAIEKKTGGDNR